MATLWERHEKYQNLRYLPAYYFIPASMLANCGAELNSIPRNPKKLLSDKRALGIVHSNLFLNLIIDAFAYMVHNFMGLGVKREIYSGYEASWIFAHIPDIWIMELERERILPHPQKLLENGGEDYDFGFMTEYEITDIFLWLVPQAMERHNIPAILKVQAEYRCFEDFDYRYSTQKIDFYRKWYHTRTKHPQISLEGFQENYANSHNGQEWDIPDETRDMEDDILSEIQADQFMAMLTDKDRQILALRMQGFTLEEIAQKLGYQNHSGVLKRIRKIGRAYEKYADVDYGFSKNRIV